MRRFWLAALVATLGCASAAERIPEERLRISARGAEGEARTAAAAWADGAALHYVEGEGVTAQGYVLPGRGAFRFVYRAPGRAQELVVAVTPRQLETVTRPPQSPPGYVIGDAPLAEGWIDSPQAVAAAREAGAEALLARGDAAAALLLVPLRPAQWIVRVAAGDESRSWRVDARTGEVLP